MTYADKTQIRGYWKDDKLDREKEHSLILKDGAIKAQNLFDPESGQLKGKGVLEMNNCTYDGTWTNGKLNGRGTMIQSDGGKYVGDFVDNVR